MAGQAMVRPKVQKVFEQIWTTLKKLFQILQETYWSWVEIKPQQIVWNEFCQPLHYIPSLYFLVSKNRQEGSGLWLNLVNHCIEFASIGVMKKFVPPPIPVMPSCSDFLPAMCRMVRQSFLLLGSLVCQRIFLLQFHQLRPKVQEVLEQIWTIF